MHSALGRVEFNVLTTAEYFMLKKFIRSIVDNLRRFLAVWGIIILANQVFIFGACFMPYCLAAALPHTFVVAVLVNFFAFRDHDNSQKTARQTNPTEPTEPTNPKLDSSVIKKIFCPICGNTMKKRLAQRGSRAGRYFFGCSNYPICKGIRNIEN